MARREVKKAGLSSSEKGVGLRKVPTHIAGLDDILNGGFPEGRTTLLLGGPGCGKSVLGLEFLYRGAMDGSSGIFVTFEERAEALRRNASGFGWDLESLEKGNTLFVLDAHPDPETILSGDFNLKGLLAIIGGKAAEMGARRIVIDAVDILLQLFGDPKRERSELYALNEWLTEQGMISIITSKGTGEKGLSSQYEFLEFMADCVLHLDQRVIEQVTTRRLRVIKYRGSGFRSNEHPFIISDEGLIAIPLSTISLKHKILGPKITSGHARLDTILDGGYRRGACVLISGTSGTGKTSLACTFVKAACGRGERVLYAGFEESEESLIANMFSPGIDLRPAVKAGTLEFITAMPEAMGAEEHLMHAIKAIRQFQPDHMVVDAISSCSRMGTEQAAFEYLMRLINTCKQKGITLVLTNQTKGFQEEHEISGIGISSVADTVIFLRYMDIGGELNRAILVLKARGTNHSNQYRELLITDHGIDILDVYAGEGGVLTGVARKEREAREAAEYRLKLQKIEQKRHEVDQRRALLEAQSANLRAELRVAEEELEALRLEMEISQELRTERARMRGEGKHIRDLPTSKTRTQRKRGQQRSS